MENCRVSNAKSSSSHESALVESCETHKTINCRKNRGLFDFHTPHSFELSATTATHCDKERTRRAKILLTTK